MALNPCHRRTSDVATREFRFSVLFRPCDPSSPPLGSDLFDGHQQRGDLLGGWAEGASPFDLASPAFASLPQFCEASQRRRYQSCPTRLLEPGDYSANPLVFILKMAFESL